MHSPTRHAGLDVAATCLPRHEHRHRGCRLCPAGRPWRNRQTLFRRNEQVQPLLPDSDLALLNRSLPAVHCGSPACSIRAVAWAASVSSGLYDPTILGDLEAAGYDRSFEYVARRAGYQWPVAADLAGTPHVARRRTADYTAVVSGGAARQVSRPAGVQLDLGGMGKGLDGRPRGRTVER